MVGRGEVLERMTVVDGPQGTLEALWQAGGVRRAKQRPVLVCPPHPRLGGSMDSAVLAELVWHLARRGHPTLRFNFAGASASQGTLALAPLPVTEPTGEPLDLTPLVDDARAALRQLCASTGEREVAVVGVSVGAAVAARLAIDDDAVTACALVAPTVTGILGPGAAIDLAALARGHIAGCPSVVVAGASDRLVDARALEAACAAVRLPITIIEHADHGFSRGLTAVARAVADALGDGDEDV